MKTPDFSSEDSGSDSSPKPNDSTKTTTTRNKTIELLYSETIIKSKQSKTSMKSLKLSKLSTTSVTTATSNPNKTTTNNVNQRSQSNGNNSNTKKKLKSFIKADDFNDDLDELMFLQMIIQGFFHIVKFIDHILYYVVSLICQLPLLLLKLLIPIFNLLRKFFNWLKSQLKKPIIIPRFYPFRCFSPLILVLDLDETLVHCTKERPDFEYEELMVFMKGKNERFFLSKRPYLEHFLEELSKFYTLVVFTSSQQEYADTVINHIDFKRAIKHRFYRQSCTKDINGYIKDLRITKFPLDRTVMIDNSTISFKFNEDNGIHIKPWMGLNDHDNELEQIMILLLGLIKETGDVRESLKTFKQESLEKSEVASVYDEEPIDYN